MLNSPFFIILVLSFDFGLRNDASWVCIFINKKIYYFQYVIFMLSILLKRTKHTKFLILCNYSLIYLVGLQSFQVVLFKVTMNTLSEIFHKENQKLEAMKICFFQLHFEYFFVNLNKFIKHKFCFVFSFASYVS